MRRVTTGGLERALWHQLRSFGRPHRRALGQIALLAGLAALTPLLSALALAHAVDSLRSEPIGSVGVRAGLLVASAGALGVGVEILRQRKMAALMAVMTGELQVRVFERLHRRPLTALGAGAVGGPSSRIVHDAPLAPQFVIDAASAAAECAATAIVAVALVSIADWRLGIIGLVLAVLTGFGPVKRLRAQMRSAMVEKIVQVNELQSFLDEQLDPDGVLTTRSMGIVGSVRHELASRVADVQSLQADVRRSAASSEGVVSLVRSVLAGLAVWAAFVVLDNGRTPGDIVLLVFAAGVVTRAVHEYSTIKFWVSTAAVVLNVCGEPLDGQPSAPTPRAVEPPVTTDGSGLVLHEVSFGYPPASLGVAVVGGREAVGTTAPIFRDLTMGVQQGEIVAVVGPTGSGKSTLALLASGMLTPSGGTVRLGGVDPTTIDPEARRSEVALVAQTAFLFRGSIRDNLVLARPGVRSDEMVTVAGAVGLHAFVSSLPLGYNTIVGERGDRLSGGQRQLISITRALLAGPRLLVLDEATAALDPVSEERVLAAIRRLAPDATTLLVAHRRSTIDAADRVVDLGSVAMLGADRAS